MWSPYHNKDMQCIEAVQRRAARFTVNCYSRYQSVSNILQKINWPTLEECRNELKLIMMYKIVHGHVHIQPILPVIRSFSNGTYHQLGDIITGFCSQPLEQTFINILFSQRQWNCGTHYQLRWSATKYLVRVHKWSSRTNYVEHKWSPWTIYVVISGLVKTIDNIYSIYGGTWLKWSA